MMFYAPQRIGISMVSMNMGGIRGSNFGWRLDCKSKTYGQTSETKSKLEADDVHRGNIRSNMGKSSYMIYEYEMSYSYVK